MKAAALLALLPAASAFMAPAPRVSRGRSMKMTTNFEVIEEEAGVSAPFGFFDPLGLSKGKTPAELKKFREAELKHGRVAMLATLGFVVQESFHPLWGFADRPVAPAVYEFQEVEGGYPFLWEALILGIGIIEGKSILKGWENPEDVAPGAIAGLKDDYIPGDLNFDPLGLKPDDEEAFKTMQTKELNNGRLAMIAIAAMVVQEKISNIPILQEKLF